MRLTSMIIIIALTFGYKSPEHVSTFLPGEAFQNLDTIPGTNLMISSRVAQKMKDTLGLSQSQFLQVAHVSYRLDSCRSHIFQNWHSQPDSLSRYLAQWSSQCDSAFRSILNDRQFFQYGMKKKSLVFNN
jgi:hypothetical protein